MQVWQLQEPFAMASLSKLYFRFILLVQTKKIFLWAMAAAQVPENHGDERGLTWDLRWRIYTSIPNWTHLQNSLAAVEALSLKIFKWSQRPSQPAWEYL